MFVNHRVILAIYVDDGLALCDDTKTLEKLLTYLNTKLTVRKVESKIFVGYEVTQKNDAIYLHQSAYIKRVLEDFNMSNCSPVRSPMADMADLQLINEDDKPFTGPYRELVGSLLYAACGTRPDILFATSVLAKYNANPKEKHWTAAKRVLRYLKGTSDFGITFTRSNQFNLTAYSDADWAGDKENRRSISGVFVFALGGPIIARSKQQDSVSLSTAEAEYVAASLASCELSWLDNILDELSITNR